MGRTTENGTYDGLCAADADQSTIVYTSVYCLTKHCTPDRQTVVETIRKKEWLRRRCCDCELILARVPCCMQRRPSLLVSSMAACLPVRVGQGKE